MTIQERGLRWWRFVFQGKIETLAEKTKRLEEVLDSVAFLRAQALAHIESLRAQVNGEDMWFTCHKQKRDDFQKGESSQ
jgi:hypothetical protein